MPPIGRRTLLGIPAAAALAGCTSPAAPPTPSARDVPSAASARDETASIVVVGAGMAGLACARTLTDQGHRVVVLEARDRIGGRIVTSRTWDKIPIDLGASWIHGTTKNPIAALASTIGARTLATSYDSGQVYIEKTLQDAGLTTPHTDRWEALATRASDLAARSASDLSVADAVKAVAPKGLSEAESSDLAFYLTGTYASEWGQSAAHLSARMMDAGEEFSGLDVLLPDGYDAIPRSLAQGLDVRLGRAVHAITHRAEGVTLETSAGRLDAKAVVVTVPLGVLKSGAIVFDPPLPAASQSAIGALSMGVLGKTFLKFDHVFWPAHIDWHEWLSRSNVWTEWVSFAKADMPVLLGFTVDDDARRIEAASERQVADEAMVAIRGMFGPDAPTPVAMQRSNWAADPYALGSYSGYGVGSTRGHRVALAQGQSQRLFLAGEATEPDYFGTAHGAYLSGLRAAKQASSMLS